MYENDTIILFQNLEYKISFKKASNFGMTHL